jgi:hypothetical protein
MRLYKYLPDKTFRDHLDSHLNGDVYLSKWSDFNDPMEGFFVYVADRDRCHVIDAIVGAKATYRVSCFCRSYNKFLLWSHYTNGHRGVCLEYDVNRRHLPPGCSLDSVQYSRTLPGLDATLPVDQQARSFLLTKMMPWRQEGEVRLLGQNLPQCTVALGRLTGIIFGVNYLRGDPNDQTRQRVVDDCRTKGASAPTLYQAVINGNSPVISRHIFDGYDQNRF